MEDDEAEDLDFSEEGDCFHDSLGIYEYQRGQLWEKVLK